MAPAAAAAREGAREGRGRGGAGPASPGPPRRGRGRLLPLPGVGLEEEKEEKRLDSPCRGHGGVLRVPLLGKQRARRSEERSGGRAGSGPPEERGGLPGKRARGSPLGVGSTPWRLPTGLWCILFASSAAPLRGLALPSLPSAGAGHSSLVWAPLKGCESVLQLCQQLGFIVMFPIVAFSEGPVLALLMSVRVLPAKRPVAGGWWAPGS